MADHSTREASEMFEAMQDAYATSGGVSDSNDLARTLQEHQQGSVSTLSRQIVGGDLFGFYWQATFWVPMFQFELTAFRLKPGPQAVRAELQGPWFDGWNLAQWFISRNTWLRERRPIDLIDSHLPEVLEAARVDRYIASFP